MGMFPPPLLVCNHCRKTRQRQLTYTAYWGVTQRSSGASGLNCRWSLLGDTILAFTCPRDPVSGPYFFIQA